MESAETKEREEISCEAVREYLAAGRAKDLSKERFPYHNWEDHVMAVYKDVRRLGKMAALKEEDIELLQIAALYHDIALPEGNKEHEERSVQVARQDLDRFGFSEDEIEKVARIILGTKGVLKDAKFVTEPSSDILVNLMRDADLSNLGKENFSELSDSLRKEFGEQNNQRWLEFQEKFLTNHEYITKEARELWGSQKQINLEKIQNSLHSKNV